MQQTRLESVTSRIVIMAVATLAGIAAFGWVLATYQPSTLDLLRQSEQDIDLAREVNEFRRRAQGASYELDFDDAIHNQHRVVNLEPFQPRNWLDLASYYDKDDQAKKARDARAKAADVQLALARDRASDAGSWRDAAILLRVIGREREARRTYRKAANAYIAAARHNGSSTAWAQAARILTDLGDVNAARQAWLGAGDAAAVELKSAFGLPNNRGDAAFWRYAGEYYIRAGELDRARDVFDDAITVLRMASDRPTGAGIPNQFNRRNGWDVLIWSGYHLGWIHRRLGQEDLAQEAWTSSLRSLEQMVDMPTRRGNQEWYNRACLRALTGDKDGAIDALERAAPSKPVSRQHAMADEDLLSLHDDERFHALVSMLDEDPLDPDWR